MLSITLVVWYCYKIGNRCRDASKLKSKSSVVVTQAKKSLHVDNILWAFSAINRISFSFFDTNAVVGYLVT
jgi:hypothetical protein